MDQMAFYDESMFVDFIKFNFKNHSFIFSVDNSVGSFLIKTG